MKTFKNVILIITCLFAFSILSWFQQGSATPSASGEKDEKSTISVSGSADVMVVPDEAVITLGVDTRNKDIVKAKEENDRKVKDIISISKKYNIDQKYIKVDYINIRPGDIKSNVYFYDCLPDKSSENYGYIAKKRIVITLKDLSRFEDFLGDLVKSGSEYISGVDFKTSELRKHKDKARELAVKAAKEKADAMSSVLGQKAGKAISINEEQEYYWSWYDSWYSGWYQSNSISAANNVQNVVAAPEQQSTGDGAVPGQIKVSAKVNIQFNLD